MSELKMPLTNRVAISASLIKDPEFCLTEHLNTRLACKRSFRDCIRPLLEKYQNGSGPTIR